jgi:hypothetical protein
MPHNWGMAKPVCMYVWEVSRIKGTPAAVIGRVENSDDKVSSAIKTAIEKFSITDPVQQQRLAARRSVKLPR